MKKILKIAIISVLLIVPLTVLKAASTANNLKGKIFLQVEDKGQAWYVSPENGKKYYMADGNEAFKIMKNLGVGISNKDLGKIKTNGNFRKKFIGKIFLQVESHGEAYYISSDGRYNYLKDGAAAFEVMRRLGQGIKNKDLTRIQTGSFSNNSNSAMTTQNVGKITYENPYYTCDNVNNKDLCVYNVIKVCDKDKKYCQEWLQENLNVGKYVSSNGSVTSDCTNIGTADVPSWSCEGNSGVQKYCYGLWNQDGGKEINCQTSGGLYEWSEAMGLPKECNNSAFDKSGKSLVKDCGVTLGSKTQGICPNGFHIPSKQEWLQLARNTINDQTCDLRDYSDGIGGCVPSGHKLKKRLNIVDIGGVANGSGSGCDASNRNDGSEKDDADCGSANFDALLGGMRDDITGRFDARGSIGFFWSATPSNASSSTDPFAYTSAFVNGQRTTQDSEVGKTNGLSVRCIKD